MRRACQVTLTTMALAVLIAQAGPEGQQRPKLLLDVLAEHKAGVASGRRDLLVADWMHWRAFHGSVEYYIERAGSSRVENVITKAVGISPAAFIAVVDEGQRYLASLDTLEAEVHAEIDRRYAVGSPVGADGRRIATVPKGQTVFNLAERDGLAQTYSKRYSATLNSHTSRLRSSLSARDFASLSSFIAAKIAPRISILDDYTPGAPRPQIPESRSAQLLRSKP